MNRSEIWDPMSLQSVIPLESPPRVQSGEVEETKGRQVEREKIFFLDFCCQQKKAGPLKSGRQK